MLAGAITLATAVAAQATPVHFALYNNQGILLSDANGVASGDVGSGNTWINNPSLIDREHLTNYLVKFWIDPVSNLTAVSWSFDWALAYGARLTTGGSKSLITASSSSSTITIGTAESDWSDISGTIIATDSAQGNFSQMTRVAAHTTYTLWNPSSTSSQERGHAAWQGGTTTEVWVYMGGRASYDGSTNVTFAPSGYANVTASADATIAQPLLPDSMFADGGTPGGGHVPEPGSLALLCGAGLAGLASVRKRRDRLKP
ncbi:MAG: PEP-CTERM sorting domain-containing protein [Rhodocyclaceae bacterium]|nr:PEP-CTERM sorting domain-containing protein [Rhodocyclaceae bacterium]